MWEIRENLSELGYGHAHPMTAKTPDSLPYIPVVDHSQVS